MITVNYNIYKVVTFWWDGNAHQVGGIFSTDMIDDLCLGHFQVILFRRDELVPAYPKYEVVIKYYNYANR